MARLAELPNFSRDIRAVRPEYRTECTILKPSHVKLFIAIIRHAAIEIAVPEPGPPAESADLFGLNKKSTDIRGPIGKARHTKIQARRDLRV